MVRIAIFLCLLALLIIVLVLWLLVRIKLEKILIKSKETSLDFKVIFDEFTKHSKEIPKFVMSKRYAYNPMINEIHVKMEKSVMK